jgi:hypothetical protein
MENNRYELEHNENILRDKVEREVVRYIFLYWFTRLSK